MREQNHRLTTGLSAVYPRFITGTKSALCFWLLTSGPTPFFPYMPCMKKVYRDKASVHWSAAVEIRQILNSFGLIGLLTGLDGFRPSRICCARLRHSGRLHTPFELQTPYAAVGTRNLQNHIWNCRQLTPARRKTQMHPDEPNFPQNGHHSIRSGRRFA